MIRTRKRGFTRTSGRGREGRRRPKKKGHAGYRWGHAQNGGEKFAFRPHPEPLKLPVGLPQVQAAARTLAGRVRRTPLLHSAALSARLGAPVWLKAESLQIGGAFKARGATNCVAAALAAGPPPRGLATYSSGNHGQGVALAARAYGLPALVVMPEDAPSVKVEGARALGAEVVFAGRTSDERRARCEAIAGERGLLVIPPFDHPD